MKLFLLFFFVLTGCPTLPQVTSNQAIGGGVIAGAALTKGAEAVKEAFTPDFKLHSNPVEICGLVDEDTVHCTLIPCTQDGVCEIAIDKSEWLSHNPKVLTLRTSQIVAIRLFCEKNTDACIEHLGEYDGTSIMLVE